MTVFKLVSHTLPGFSIGKTLQVVPH